LHTADCDAPLACDIAGSNRAATIAIVAITTSSSRSVKPARTQGPAPPRCRKPQSRQHTSTPLLASLLITLIRIIETQLGRFVKFAGPATRQFRSIRLPFQTSRCSSRRRALQTSGEALWSLGELNLRHTGRSFMGAHPGTAPGAPALAGFGRIWSPAVPLLNIGRPKPAEAGAPVLRLWVRGQRPDAPV
jgi:hypothetical protein